MPTARTARERVRAELIAEIKAEARRQLVELGAAQLSLRSVTRALEMVPSALYRYYPSKEELLTDLIVDAYNSVGARVEAASAEWSLQDHHGRWLASCRALRAWAIENPHEYALIYASPMPGYQAPDRTVAPATRVPFLFLGLVRDAWLAGQLRVEEHASSRLSKAQAANAAVLAAGTGLSDLPSDVLLRAVTAYTQVFGAVTLEVLGHLRGAFEDDAVFFDYSIGLTARLVGLTPASADPAASSASELH